MAKPDQQPFHSGEIYYLWTYLHETKELLVTIQVLRNHTEDNQLKRFLDDILENCFSDHGQQIEAILKDNGIRLPPAPPDRPNVELSDIPAGARFNDPEIYRLLQKELTARISLCSYIIGLSNHEMIKEIFADFHSLKLEYELKLTKLATEKGWYTSPPINIK